MLQAYQECHIRTKNDLDIATIIKRQKQCLIEISKLKKQAISKDLLGIHEF
jgi:hypothetical protein